MELERLKKNVLLVIRDLYLIQKKIQTLHMQSYKSTQNNSIEGARNCKVI